MPTMPPAGPDRIASLPWKRCASVSPPLRLHEEQAHARHLRRPPGRRSGAGSATGRRRPPWCRRATTSFISGLTSCDTLTCVKPIVARQRAAACSCAVIAVAVHEDDRAGCAGRRRTRPAARARSARLVQRLHHLAVRADALVGLDHALVQQLGQHDVAVEQPRPVLVGDAQRVAKAARGDQQRAARPCARAARWWPPWCPSSRTRPARA